MEGIHANGQPERHEYHPPSGGYRMKGIPRNDEPENVKEYISSVLNLIRNCTGTYEEFEQIDIVAHFFRLPPNWENLKKVADQLGEDL